MPIGDTLTMRWAVYPFILLLKTKNRWYFYIFRSWWAPLTLTNENKNFSFDHVDR